ncbi:serine hydrolase domain-containing protein [Marivita hallyeonensis]|uniref:Beta-lactamase n=1 Tax=Marivita hallyeonensis TaxID=996342 RepID=A0A1M5W4E2_9RHOB|nr:serine hydrolase domain-containing protein [Marivita hallyeonensis]SHH82392.1 Beta-lactamase [Marivita hallyeonensis]
MYLRAAAILVWIACGATAQTANGVADAVQGWLTERDASGVVAMQSPDGAIQTIDLGLPTARPVELASLSKAITAVCVADLVADRKLRWADPVSLFVPGFDEMTVGDLVTHESGVIEDATQRHMSAWLGDPRHRADAIVTKMRTRKAPQGPQDVHVYSNDNFALLALVIENVTQDTYEAACRARVLDTAGVAAAPSPVSGAFLSWGGWSMTADDYLRFHAHWFDTSDPTRDEPMADLGGGAVYERGMLARSMRGGSNYWHFGALCFPERLNVGSYVVGFFNGWRVVVAYDACVEWEAMVALDAAIVQAIFAAD